ncbi:MAG: hypothetical protein DRM97_07590 [Thermoprotei archaeon]|nr:MAG: hypothetical protein DRM97_07590 [Thermoprotei archaeon]
MGAAAQEGVPEVYKMALKMKKNLIFLADLEDVLEVIKPSEVLLFVSKHHAKAEFKPDTVVEMLRRGEKVVLIFGGAEPGLTKRDLEKGQPVYVKVPGDIGPLGTMAIVLYLLYKGLTSRESP